MISTNPFVRAATLATAMIVVGVALASGGTPQADAPVGQPSTREYIVHWPTGSASALADMDGVRVLSTPGSDELAKLGAFVVRVDGAGTIDAILAAGAEYVEPNAVLTGQGIGPTAADPLISQQWFHAAVGSPAAWRSAKGAGVRVAVVDSGVGPHPDLSVVGGHDFTGGDGQWTDLAGHGTHVAGICCARGDNGIGGSGIAPQADVLSARVLGSNGMGTIDGIAAGIIWSADQGARVINLSVGGPTGSRALQEALAYAAGRGALPVCAAGNDSSTRPGYPAAYPDCLSVGASGKNDVLAVFSNRHASIDITAPGMSIFSTCKGGGYCLLDGTSMAAPIVSGAAALVASLSPISPAALSWRLRSTAALRSALPGGKRIDVGAALAARQTALPRPPTLAPRPTAPATARPLPTSAPTSGVQIIPIAVPPGCRVVIMCDQP